LAFEYRLAHVNADAHRLAALRLDFKRENTSPGLDGQRRLRGNAVIVDVLGDATDAVAAHLRLAAVRVEHAHAGVGALRRADENQPVAADAEVPVADDLAQLG